MARLLKGYFMIMLLPFDDERHVRLLYTRWAVIRRILDQGVLDIVRVFLSFFLSLLYSQISRKRKHLKLPTPPNHTQVSSQALQNFFSNKPLRYTSYSYGTKRRKPARGIPYIFSRMQTLVKHVTVQQVRYLCTARCKSQMHRPYRAATACPSAIRNDTSG